MNTAYAGVGNGFLFFIEVVPRLACRDCYGSFVAPALRATLYGRPGAVHPAEGTIIKIFSAAEKISRHNTKKLLEAKAARLAEWCQLFTGEPLARDRDAISLRGHFFANPPWVCEQNYRLTGEGGGE